jgi:hypothetical protein
VRRSIGAFWGVRSGRSAWANAEVRGRGKGGGLRVRGSSSGVRWRLRSRKSARVLARKSRPRMRHQSRLASVVFLGGGGRERVQSSHIGSSERERTPFRWRNSGGDRPSVWHRTRSVRERRWFSRSPRTRGSSAPRKHSELKATEFDWKRPRFTFRKLYSEERKRLSCANVVICRTFGFIQEPTFGFYHKTQSTLEIQVIFVTIVSERWNVCGKWYDCERIVTFLSDCSSPGCLFVSWCCCR